MNLLRSGMLIAAALSIVAITAPAAAQNAEVCFYEHSNYQGKRICERPGRTVEAMPAFNDVISSISIRGRAQVKVCEHNGFGGRCRIIKRDTAYVGDRWNDRISSLKVRRRFANNDGNGNGRKRVDVCFYEHSNFQGKRICVRRGRFENRMPAFNDVISSITVRGNARVQVCEHTEFGGRCRSFDRDTAFVGNQWNDRISSFYVK